MRASMTRLLPLILIAGLGLTACGSDMDDLDKYINDVKAKPGGRIDPLPEITPYEVFTYIADAEGLRSPFVPDSPQTKLAISRSACQAAIMKSPISSAASQPCREL